LNYGLYLSATGVLTNAYRQDVIANNLANSETIGFKRNFAIFHERLAEAVVSRQPGASDPLLDPIGGGLLISPTAVDLSQGELEFTGRDLDVAIQGKGYFAVLDGKQKRLTRDGRFMLDRQGNLVLANGTGQRILDEKGKPITIDPSLGLSLRIDEHGQISSNRQFLGRVGMVDVPDPKLLVKVGGTLLRFPDNTSLHPANATTRSQFLERSNVDPILELTQLIDTQRQLEANANMIRYQDQTMGRLVNDAGKIG
jgi:flagellar basal body rod protein FlgG